jgi:hypothetical protein
LIPKLFPPPVLAALHADLQKNEWFLEMPVLHHPSGKRGVKIVVKLHDFLPSEAKTYIRSAIARHFFYRADWTRFGLARSWFSSE